MGAPSPGSAIATLGLLCDKIKTYFITTRMDVMKASRMMYVSLILFFNLVVTSVFACTGIQLKAKDGSYVNGRTVEFGVPLDLAGLIVPRNYEFKGSLPDGSNGLVYRSKYAVVGAGAFGAPAI